MTPEFSRMLDIRNLPNGPLKIEANTDECAALANRMGIEAVERLSAEVTMEPAGGVIAVSGRIEAEIIQQCAISNEPFPTRIGEPLFLRFVQGITPHKPDEELEIDADACDEIEFEGTQFDLGEQIAQTLSLAIDPYATGPNAERVRQEAGLSDVASSGPFAALAALRKP
jgi:uncharacterized metal-binding protein YceD (DUF177 family)